MQFQAEHVLRYYEDNTRLFLRLGQGTEGTIRRAIWGPGVRNRTEAMAYVDGLILERLRQHRPADGSVPHVVDLGCGVCASLCRLAKLEHIQGTGVTLSPTQVSLARERIEAHGLSGSVRCLRADYSQLPPEVGPANLAFAIESFVHAPNAGALFRESAALLKSGGLFIVCDDFVADERFETDPRASVWIDRFRQGWVASSVIPLAKAEALASEHGFVLKESLDLTRYIELRRPRDWAISALMRVLGWVPGMGSYFSMLRGGDALQLSLRKGWVQHRFVVWQKV